MPERAVTVADAVPGGVRLTLPVRVGALAAEVVLEAGHCERLFRMAAYVARRSGRLRLGERVVARLVSGAVRERHDGAVCLDACAVELVAAGGQGRARVEFPRATFAAYALARAMHLLGGEPAASTTPVVAYCLHAHDAADAPVPVARPRLRPLSVATLARAALPRGAPGADWIGTFLTAEAAAGLEEIAHLSRVRGVEAAGRLHTRVGFDARRGCFVRILDRLVIARAAAATPLAVVSPAASWAEFLAAAPTSGSGAFASVHTHLHLGGADRPDDGPGAARLEDHRSLDPTHDPCISIADIVTHYTAFPDPLSAALIVSVYPERHDVTLYGYTPQGPLRVEPGYWVLARGWDGTREDEPRRM
jgi:hypothetical protein